MNGKIGWKTILVVAVILLFIFLFISSLGQYNPTGIAKPEEFKDDREKAKLKHKWYQEILKSKKKLKQYLDKKFKRIYFGVRAGLILLWALLMYGLYAIGIIVGTGGVVTYTSVVVIAVIGTNYLTSGTYLSLRDFLETIRIKTENWVYGEYIDLDKEIEESQLELKISKENAVERNSN